MRIDFSKGKTFVAGDLMLDRYHFGSVSRISPEAPVPVVKVSKSHSTLGGAGNVANNLAHLGAGVVVAGPLCNDESGTLVRALCRQNGITLAPIDTDLPTITKMRIIGERQQIVRVDFEEPCESGPRDAALVKKTAARWLAQANVLVISDYGKGFCSDEFCAFAIGEARKKGIPVIVDPKGHRWDKYRGATIVTPNVKELSDIAGHAVRNDDGDIAVIGRKIRSRFGIGSLLITRSEKGMTLVGKASTDHFPTEAREVFDVSGAGDTVVATLAAALAAGYSLHDAVALSNKAAGIVVGKIGTVPVEIGELRNKMENYRNRKLLEAGELVTRCLAERERGKRIVFTNGSFDILHRGNVHLLQEAKRLGDILVVALNSDRSAAAHKGRGFPINGESDRAHLMAAIDAVDFITIFDEPTPIKLIRQLRPDVLVKGGNYRETDVLGREAAGKTVIIPQLEGYSTDEIAKKLVRGMA